MVSQCVCVCVHVHLSVCLIQYVLRAELKVQSPGTETGAEALGRTVGA